MEMDLSVFVAKTNRGYVGYVRIHKGRVLRYTEICSTQEQAYTQAAEMRDILQEYPQWWEL